jgi:hypothetical protein
MNETSHRRNSLRARGYFVTSWGNYEMTFSSNESIGWWPTERIARALNTDEADAAVALQFYYRARDVVVSGT